MSNIVVGKGIKLNNTFAWNNNDEKINGHKFSKVNGENLVRILLENEISVELKESNPILMENGELKIELKYSDMEVKEPSGMNYEKLIGSAKYSGKDLIKGKELVKRVHDIIISFYTYGNDYKKHMI